MIRINIVKLYRKKKKIILIIIKENGIRINTHTHTTARLRFHSIIYNNQKLRTFHRRFNEFVEKILRSNKFIKYKSSSFKSSSYII